MVFQCCVYNCRNFSDKCNPVGLFRFPKVKIQVSATKKEILKRRREAWFNAVKKKGMNIEKLNGYRICSKHFSSGQPSHYLDDTNPDWVPHLHMGYSSSKTTVMEGSVDSFFIEERERQKIARYLRRKNRDKRIEIEVERDRSTQEEQTLQLKDANISQITESEPETRVFTKIDVDADKFATLQAEFIRLQEGNTTLKTKLRATALFDDCQRKRIH